MVRVKLERIGVEANRINRLWREGNIESVERETGPAVERRIPDVRPAIRVWIMQLDPNRDEPAVGVGVA